MLPPCAMKITTLQYVLWFIAPALQVLVAYAMIWRRQVKEFPLFFAYTVFHIVQFPVTYYAHSHSYKLYFYAYWVGEFIDVVFVLLVLQRLFIKVLDPYKALRKLGGTVLLWGMVGLCTVALITVLAAPSAYTDRLMSSLLLLDRSAEFIEAGLFLILFLFSRLFGLGWRHYLFGIALGFGLSAAVALVVDAFRNQFGPGIERVAAPLIQCAYVLGTGVWAYYFLSHRSVTRIGEIPSYGQLQQWNEALAGYLGPDSRSTMVQKH